MHSVDENIFSCARILKIESILKDSNDNINKLIQLFKKPYITIIRPLEDNGYHF
jgi:hypothetical protein